MKLLIQGTIHERGAFAPFESAKEDLPSLKGKRIGLPIPDTYLEILEVKERSLRFRFIRFEEADELLLRFDESHEFTHEGNAFGYKIKFQLAE